MDCHLQDEEKGGSCQRQGDRQIPHEHDVGLVEPRGQAKARRGCWGGDE